MIAQEKKRSSSTDRLVRGAFLVLVAIAVGGFAYWSLRARGRIPKAPQVVLHKSEQERSMRTLVERVKGFQPTAEHRVLMEKLEEIHRVESGQTDPGADSTDLRRLLPEMRALATEVALKNQEGYLVLGDVLALEFHRALVRLLVKLREKKPEATRDREQEQLLADIGIKGGAFWRHAVERGVIGVDGTLNVPEMTPQVLFRYRWRNLGGLAPDTGFLPVEKKARLDFQLKFVATSSIRRKLGVIDQIAELDDSYDRVIARAMTFYDAGEKDRAKAELERALEVGRSDRAILDFLRALDE